MKEEKKITQTEIDEARVVLRPVAGISPRVYVPAMYCAALTVLLFLALVLPGIRKNGSYLRFEGSPATAGVFVDGAYKGSTGQSIFVPSGSHRIEIERFGFSIHQADIQVKGRLIGSLLAPRIQTIDYALQLKDSRALVEKSFSEYSAWALTGKPSALYQIPTLLSEAATALAASGEVPAEAFARDTLSVTASAESARDGMNAAAILASSGIASPLSIAAAARLFVSALGRDKAGAVWLSDQLGSRSPESLSAIASGVQKEFTQKPPATRTSIGYRGSLRVAGQDFSTFSGGRIELGGMAPSGSQAPYEAELGPFGLAVTEVTNRQWAQFLAANPSWRPEAKPALIEKGLVDDSYLENWTGIVDDKPVTGISWHAAAAYCEWLDSSQSGAYRVTLPSEAMWEAAAVVSGLAGESHRAVWSDGVLMGPEKVGSMGFAPTGMTDLLGNVWEWMADGYRPYPAFAAGTYSGAEKAVRGGSWANQPGTVSLDSRGGVPALHASSFLGFRPALVAR